MQQEVQAMETFSVAVESEDIHEGEWNDILIVLAHDAREARDIARDFVNQVRQTTEIKDVEAYALDGNARVIGRLIDTDEE